MELCANGALVSNIPKYHRLPPPSPQNPLFTPSLPLLRLHTISASLRVRARASASEETPIERTKFEWDTSSRIIPVEDEKNTSVEDQTRADDSPLEQHMQHPFGQLFDKLNFKLDTQDSYSLLLYGGGALVSVWILSAVVGAVDSIPVFPELMEVVGLSYSVWFTTRYLIFKENRDELVTKIEEIKQQVLGSDK